MKEFKFYWLNGESTEWQQAHDVADAFSKLGYGGGAIQAVDYYDEREIKEGQDNG